MNDAILVINAGSSSLKFAILVPGEQSEALDRIYHGQIEPIGQHAAFKVYDDHCHTLLINNSIAVPDHEAAFLAILTWLEQQDTS